MIFAILHRPTPWHPLTKHKPRRLCNRRICEKMVLCNFIYSCSPHSLRVGADKISLMSIGIDEVSRELRASQSNICRAKGKKKITMRSSKNKTLRWSVMLTPSQSDWWWQGSKDSNLRWHIRRNNFTTSSSLPGFFTTAEQPSLFLRISPCQLRSTRRQCSTFRVEVESRINWISIWQ